MDNLTAKPLKPFMDLGALAPNPTREMAQGDLNKFYQTRSSPVSYWEAAESRYGLPEARTKVADSRKAIDDTNSMIRAVDPSVTGRTSGYNVTEAQRKALIAKEKNPMLQGLQSYSDIYATNQRNLTDVLGMTQQWRDDAYKTDENLLAALLQRLGQANQIEEEAANARAAAAQQKYYTDLFTPQTQPTWATQQNQQAQQQLLQAFGGLGGGLQVKPNYGFQAPNINPQAGAWNPQQAISPQKTGTVQSAYNPQSWYNNVANKSTPLKVTNTKPAASVKVTKTQPAKKMTVTSGGYGSGYKGNVSVR